MMLLGDSRPSLESLLYFMQGRLSTQHDVLSKKDSSR